MPDQLRRDLEAALEGDVRFDALTRALYSTDASVYQIEPTGVVIVRSREDVVRTIEIARRHGVTITARGGGTSQAGQAIGAGLQLDTAKYFNRLLEVNVDERWARVEPGIVLDELNAQLVPHRLRFAPDISTASRATVGGMISNNSSGARSVLYGKTIDHVLDLHVALADGSVVHLRPLATNELDAICEADTLEGRCYRTVRRLGAAHAAEVNRRYPKILRRVGGYNLDAFCDPSQPFDLTKLVVGSEGTLGLLVEARVRLVPLPGAKAVLTIEFDELLDALGATPAILEHRPSAIEVMDRFILDHARESPEMDQLRRSVLQGETPGALLCVELYADDADELPTRLEAIERDLAARGIDARTTRAVEPGAQARIWRLRQSALGLSMAMKGDAKSVSFVEDTAVAPERLRDYIARFLEIVRRHGSTTGVYAHASVGCLHVRPVVNLKTADGVAQFEAIANDIADLVLEFGGALSGEHGDGLVRGPFIERMFGSELYGAFRAIKQTFDPTGLFNPGKIVDSPPLTANLRYGAGYRTPDPVVHFDYTEHGGLGRAVEMCSGIGACRKTLDGTMCPSYMATRDETHSTRGRANALRYAMTGRLGETGLGDDAVFKSLDLCLECRACKAECPVGVDMARFKSEFLADYWRRHGTPLRARVLGGIHELSALASPFARLLNPMLAAPWLRSLNERLLGLDRRRALPRWAPRTLATRWSERAPARLPSSVVLFNDTFTNYYHPEIGLAAAALCDRAGVGVDLGPTACCGRPLISQGLLPAAARRAAETVRRLHPLVVAGKRIIVLEPSCLSALRDDLPGLLRGVEQRQAREVADACLLFEEWLEAALVDGRAALSFRAGPRRLLLHGHCHQKSLGLMPPAMALLARIPDTEVVDLDAGCCGMAGSFGYAREHFDISRQIGERRLLPAARALAPDEALVASGVSCRHQVRDLAGVDACHPAELLLSLLPPV
jgi:FAD/FMN-containing dehydrogenase/Fe-S oxidoreductase